MRYSLAHQNAWLYLPGRRADATANKCQVTVFQEERDWQAHWEGWPHTENCQSPANRPSRNIIYNVAVKLNAQKVGGEGSVSGRRDTE